MDETKISKQESQGIDPFKDLEHQAAASVLMAIKLGMVLNEKGTTINNQPFFRGNYEGLLKMTGDQSFWSPDTGVITEGTEFTSIRDSWEKLDHYPWNWDEEHQYHGLPHIVGKSEEDTGRKVIEITSNSDSGSDFNNQVLETGRGSVLVYDTGELKYHYAGEKRNLTKLEMGQVKAIFQDACIKLQERQKLRGLEKPKP